MDYTETLSETLELRKGLITNTRLDRVNLPNGETSLREVVEHPGGVAIIPVDEDGFVYCVRQFRYPFQEHLIELPAGKLEYGEDPLDCAVRELSEETGIQAREFICLGKLYPSPGYCRETLYIYMAAGLAHGEAHLDQNEFLDVMRIHIDELVRMVLDNELSDAKTALGILKAKALLDKK